MVSGRPPSVFADSNVIYSGIYSPERAPDKVLRLHASGRITLVVSQTVLNEVYRSLGKKVPHILPMLDAFLRDTPPVVVAHPSESELKAVSPQINPEDAPIIASALAADIDWFVTGDKRLLDELRRAEMALRAASPADFLAEFAR